MLEGREYEDREMKGILFDCYNTLIDIQIDEDSLATYEPLSRWLTYQGVKIGPADLMREYKSMVEEELESRHEMFPEISIEKVFGKLCSEHAFLPVDEMRVGVEAAKVFRAASMRRFSAFPQSVRLLALLDEYPMGIIANGQRIFSEIELRYLDLSKYFEFEIFSSDIGHKKPDMRMFKAGAEKLELSPEDILCIGDNFETDIIPAVKLGMRTYHIEEAWKIFNVI